MQGRCRRHRCRIRFEAHPRSPRFRVEITRLDQGCHQLPVMGVEYLSYPGPGNEGFVVAFVPQSGHKPHRAEWANKQYYYRAGDDFLPAEPSMLRLLFYPKYIPNFDININLNYKKEVNSIQTSCKLFITMDILNIGNSSAHDIFISVRTVRHDCHADTAVAEAMCLEPDVEAERQRVAGLKRLLQGVRCSGRDCRRDDHAAECAIEPDTRVHIKRH